MSVKNILINLRLFSIAICLLTGMNGLAMEQDDDNDSPEIVDVGDEDLEDGDLEDLNFPDYPNEAGVDQDQSYFGQLFASLTSWFKKTFYSEDSNDNVVDNADKNNYTDSSDESDDDVEPPHYEQSFLSNFKKSMAKRLCEAGFKFMCSAPMPNLI